VYAQLTSQDIPFLVMCRLGLEATGQAMCSAWAAPGSGLEFCKPEAVAQATACVAIHSHYPTNHDGHTINEAEGGSKAWAYEVRPLFFSYFLLLTFSCRPPLLHRLNRDRGAFLPTNPHLTPPPPLPRSNARWRGFYSNHYHSFNTTTIPHSLEHEMGGLFCPPLPI